MEKQIEEMAKALTSYERKLCERLPKDKCLLSSAIHAQVSCDYCKISEFLVNAGYRKASEVAEDIFAEIEPLIDGSKYALLEIVWNIKRKLAELKKKYTEVENEQRKAD